MRTSKIPNTDKLLQLIPEYGSHKSTLDEYDKICKSENAEIKRIMKEEGIDNMQAGGYKVSYSVRETSTMNEDKLLALLQDKVSAESGIVKTKKYVDMDALESAIYNGAIPKEVLIEMDNCREKKQTVSLRITKVKEENNGKDNDN
jgi:hypothetical protein